MSLINPTLEWYESISERKNILARCPFGSVYRCPRYYQSISLIGNMKISTSLKSEEDSSLLERWKKSDLWPVVHEQATSVSGSPGKLTFSKFCPEVLFEVFGLFASVLIPYADEIDRGHAHIQLSKINANINDWRWRWVHIDPMHYSNCSLFAPLTSKPIEITSSKKSRIGF